MFHGPWRDNRGVIVLPMIIELFLGEVRMAFNEANDGKWALG